jgi:uncharacterized protein (DUF1778 family)
MISLNMTNADEANDRTALLIYCSQEERALIRHAAKRERRTISGFVMNAVMVRLDVESRIQERHRKRDEAAGGKL